MKYVYLLTLTLMVTLSANAQVVDTVLFENFQTDNFENYQLFALGNDTVWCNIDEDGLTPNTGDDVDRQWFYDDDGVVIDSTTGELNHCATSLSYMEDFLPGNRNWLVTPPVTITNANHTLHWKSSSYQLPRYMDGYLVMAGLQNIPGTFPDTLFQAASMEAITGDGESLDLSNFTFTPGYFHADSLRDNNYFEVANDSTLAYGLFEPHSVSLSQYAGQTVYFAFLHNSDDDYYFSIDDILIVSTTTSGLNDFNKTDFRFVTYPNPVQNFLNVMYRLPEAAPVSLQVSDMSGKIVLQPLQQVTQQAGEQQLDLDLRRFAPGTYGITLQIDGQAMTKMFVKR